MDVQEYQCMVIKMVLTEKKINSLDSKLYKSQNDPICRLN